MSRRVANPDTADEQAAQLRTGDRVAKLLARAGIASRREVERMIAEGRVARDGKAIETPNTVLASLAGVTVDGRPVAAPAPAQLFLYHKPVDLLVTERDPGGRPTIYDRLPAELPRVVPVGRLDLNTEGLLLLTTDGGLKRQLELPANGVPRTYRARAHGPVTQAQLEELIDGIEIDGIRYGSIDANLERRTGTNVWIELTLTEGKNREVRRVLEHLGLLVGRLIRTRYGPFVLGDLPAGEVGEVRQHDLVAFRQSLDGKRPVMVDPIAPTPLRAPRNAVDPTSAAPHSDDRTRTARVTGRTTRPAHAGDISNRPRADAPAQRADDGRSAVGRSRGVSSPRTAVAARSPRTGTHAANRDRRTDEGGGSASFGNRATGRSGEPYRSARANDTVDRPRATSSPARRFGKSLNSTAQGSPHGEGAARSRPRDSGGAAQSDRAPRRDEATSRSTDRAIRPDRSGSSDPRKFSPSRPDSTRPTSGRPGSRKLGPGNPRPPRPGKPRTR